MTNGSERQSANVALNAKLERGGGGSKRRNGGVMMAPNAKTGNVDGPECRN